MTIERIGMHGSATAMNIVRAAPLISRDFFVPVVGVAKSGADADSAILVMSILVSGKGVSIQESSVDIVECGFTVCIKGSAGVWTHLRSSRRSQLLKEDLLS